MKNRFRVFVFSWLTVCAVFGAVRLVAQTPIDSWPTYHGDWSGRRYSALKQVDRTNVKHLTLAWTSRVTSGTGGGGGGTRCFFCEKAAMENNSIIPAR